MMATSCQEPTPVSSIFPHNRNPNLSRNPLPPMKTKPKTKPKSTSARIASHKPRRPCNGRRSRALSPSASDRTRSITLSPREAGRKRTGTPAVAVAKSGMRGCPGKSSPSREPISSHSKSVTVPVVHRRPSKFVVQARQKLAGASDRRLTREESMEMLRRAALKHHGQEMIRIRFERWFSGPHQPSHAMKSNPPAAFRL